MTAGGGHDRSDGWIASDEDKHLALAFQRGEKGAYQAIHDRYRPRVDGVCRKMLGQREDAQEAAQETFLRVYQALPQFNGRYQMGAWITRIATNVCLDALRARIRHPGADMDDSALYSVDSGVDSDPQNIVVRNAEGRRVRRALQRLAPMHRAAIVLRDFEGLSYADVAGALDITESQAKALIHRSRCAFRRVWTSPLAALIPTSLLQRFRRLDRVGNDNFAHVSRSGHHAAEVVTSSSQYVASCTGFIQQCGQVVSERLAPAIAAALVGSAAGVAVASDAPLVDKVVVETAGAPANDPVVRRAEKEVERQLAGERAGEQPTPPTEQPSVAPKEEPTPAPKPVTEPSPAPPKEGDKKEQPEPSGFALAFGSDIAAPEQPCPCLRSTGVVSESVNASESGVTYVKQTLEGSASAQGEESFGLSLDHSAHKDSHTLNFFLHTSEGAYGYRAHGLLMRKMKTDWGGWHYVYEGSYELSSRPGGTETMPVRGHYVVELVVSWRQGAVISSSFSLTESTS